MARLVFLDESGLNAAMTRSHAWVRRGREYVERTPMNWGNNLTLLGAMRLTGWVLQSAMYATTNSDRFVAWLGSQLLPRLKKGDVLVMDNLKAHHDGRVELLCRRFGIRLIYLPPYSHDFNPIEPGWGHQKQFVRRHAPEKRTRWYALPAWRVTGSRPTTVALGFVMPDIRFNPGDHWD